jgi:hypothetical protein
MHFYIHAAKDFEEFNRDFAAKAGPFSKDATITFSSPEDKIVTVDKITPDEVDHIIKTYRADPKFALG